METNDRELVEKAKQGDKYAFVTLFDRYKEKLTQYLWGYIGDYQAAEDLTIETFLNVYEHLSTYEEMGRFSAWLYLIAKNLAKNEFRRRAHHKEISLEKPINAEKAMSLGDLIADDKNRPDYDAMAQELKKLVFETISGLEGKYKDVLVLCDVEGLSYEEAANILKCNPLTISTWLRRAREKLHAALRKYGYKF